ncbi:hypothetical protein BH11PSE4_BH11PSE4_14990 [soil metagenome]
MLRSARHLPRGALLIRGPGWAMKKPGSPDLRSSVSTLQRVRETTASYSSTAGCSSAPGFADCARSAALLDPIISASGTASSVTTITIW